MKNTTPANRTKTGRFVKGQSGNPRGRPKNEHEQMDALKKIRNLSPAAADVVKDILNDPKVSAAIRLRAAELVLDRTYGKSTQAIELDGALPVIIDDIPDVPTGAEHGG